MPTWLYLLASTNPYNITCTEVQNCSTKTKTIDMAFTNAAHGLLFVIGMLAVVFVIVSALQMALSAGNAKRFQQGRESLLYSVVGVVLATIAYGIVSFIAGAF